MFALVLDLLILSLKVLDLGVFQSQFFKDLIVLGMGVGGLDAVLLLLFFYLLKDFGQSLLLDLVRVALVFYFLVLVHFFNVLLVYFVLFAFIYLAYLVRLHFFTVQGRYF